MDKAKKNKLTAAVAGLLALGGLGMGVAAASTPGSSGPGTVLVQPAAATSVAPGNDNLQEGDQNGPDDANEANETNDPNEKEGNEKEGNEKPGTEDPSDDSAPRPGGSSGQSSPVQGSH